jgi:hypothetical protein
MAGLYFSLLQILSRRIIDVRELQTRGRRSVAGPDGEIEFFKLT